MADEKAHTTFFSWKSKPQGNTLSSMPVSDRFSVLIGRITPTPRERHSYKIHLDTVTNAIRGTFGVVRVGPIGSYLRATAVRNVSDLDVLAVLKAGEKAWGDSEKSSLTVLRNLKDALQVRLPATDIRSDENAVVVHFRGGDRPVDVVPAFYKGPATAFRNYPLYKIPDGSGGWLTTSPDAHNAYLKAENSSSRGKLTRLAQLAKWWAACHPHVSMTSFYAEMIIASEGICRSPIGYASALHGFFRALQRKKCASIADPLGICWGRIPSSRSTSGRERLEVAVNKAYEHSACALQAESVRNTPEAVRQWSIVFNHQAFAR